MTDNKYAIKDLIRHSVDQKPVDFENVFNGLALDRLQKSIDLKKQEMAKYIFNGRPETRDDNHGQSA